MSYSIDDLPKYSAWAKRLLGIEAWSPKHKNAQELEREYEGEKWGPLLHQLHQSRPLNIEIADRLALGTPQEVLCFDDGQFEPVGLLTASQRYVQIVKDELRPYLSKASALVELGSGYGTIILNIAKDPDFAHLSLHAGEFAKSGVEAIRLIAQAEEKKITAASCDFFNLQLSELQIPESALIFTSYALACVPELPNSFMDALMEAKAIAVVHIEPCYEHCDEKSLFGLLRKKYFEVNDYNRNLRTLLAQYEAEDKITMLTEKPVLFGSNPLLPVSVLAWKNN